MSIPILSPAPRFERERPLKTRDIRMVAAYLKWRLPFLISYRGKVRIVDDVVRKGAQVKLFSMGQLLCTKRATTEVDITIQEVTE